MKLGTGTIGTVIFAAIGTAAFVWMAKRPAVDTTAMQFGVVNTEANNKAQVDSASADTPASMKDEPTTPSNDQNTVTESTITSETTSAHADDNASVETKGSTDEKTEKEDVVEDVVKKEEINENAAVEKSDDSSDVAPKEPESVTSDKPETVKPVIEMSTPVVPAIPIMPDMPAGKPAELHAPVPTTTIEEVKTPEVGTTSPSEASTISEPAVSEPVISPDNVPPGHRLEPKAPIQMDTPAETVTPSQAQEAENGITTEPATQSAGEKIKTSSEETSTGVSTEGSSSTSVKKEGDMAADVKRLPKTITIRTDEIFGKSLPANLTNQLPETIEIPVDLLFDRSATEE